MTELREQVRDKYGELARGFQTTSGCCGTDDGCGSSAFGGVLYDPAETADVSTDLIEASLGCGNPTAMVELHDGEVVLDLGSGAGLDVLLSARRVGPTGKAYGVDMTAEMLELARANAERAGVSNVEFLEGLIEDVPLPDASVDVVISNCVINLSVDKPAVFAELARVVRPGGRLAISDVVADDRLTPEQRAERGSYVGCIAGALSFGEYAVLLREHQFAEVTVDPTHAVAEGMYAATIRAVRG